MKRIIAVLMVITTLLVGCCSCSTYKPGRETIVFEQDEYLAQYLTDNNKPMEIIDETDECKTVFFYRGEQKIHSMIYLPEGKGPFPVVLISGGLGCSLTSNYMIAKKLADNGIVGVVYDPVGMVADSLSDGNFLDYSVMTQAADMEAIIASLSEEAYVDTNQIFLWGHSLGGFASCYVGVRNPDIIKGMVLVEPSLFVCDNAREKFDSIENIPDKVTDGGYFGGAFYRDVYNFDIYDFMKDYNGSVLIFKGTRASTIGKDMPEVLTKADELFPSSELIGVDADHSFAGQPMDLVAKETVDFVKAHAK